MNGSKYNVCPFQLVARSGFSFFQRMTVTVLSLHLPSKSSLFDDISRASILGKRRTRRETCRRLPPREMIHANETHRIAIVRKLKIHSRGLAASVGKLHGSKPGVSRSDCILETWQDVVGRRERHLRRSAVNSKQLRNGCAQLKATLFVAARARARISTSLIPSCLHSMFPRMR